MMTKEVVVSGIGAISRGGSGPDFWNGLFSGPPDDDWAVHQFNVESVGTAKELRRLDRFSQFALSVSDEALRQADLTSVEDTEGRYGIILGVATGGWSSLAQGVINVVEERPVSSLMIPMTMANAAAANISIRWGWHGPIETIVTACASGNHALVNAWQLVASGRCDLVLAGGVESPILPFNAESFANAGALSPTNRSRPFAVDRDGFALSEGAGVLVLESLEHAHARSHSPIAQILGGWVNGDAFHLSAPRPDGSWVSDCMTKALKTAGLSTRDISWINAHGTGTPLNDKIEIDAIRSTFGSTIPPVSSIKGSTGHTAGAAGAIEAVATVESLLRGCIPPTVTDSIDPAFGDIDLVTESRCYVPGPVISNSFGFGGHNACLVIAPYS